MDVQEWSEGGKESFHSDVLAEGSKLEWMAAIQSFISHSTLYEEKHSVLLNINSLLPYLLPVRLTLTHLQSRSPYANIQHH